MSQVDCITVCICTFRRPLLLARLLDALASQATHDAFTFNCVVVDNDTDHSSEEVVSHCSSLSTLAVTYECEPDRNISLARNRAIQRATGNLVALIDDDECPCPEWLLHLYRTLKGYGADGVLGPVIPEIPPEAPRWLRDGHVFDRKRHPTGTKIGASDARTGNVLLERSLFVDDRTWFDPSFGRTGGEDSDFFSRQLRDGRVFIWCDEAIAHEAVPPERWKASFHVKRHWRSGTISGEWMREGRLASSLVGKNLLALSLCTLAVPMTLFFPKHLRMRVLQKVAYTAGVVTAFAGLSVLKYRE